MTSLENFKVCCEILEVESGSQASAEVLNRLISQRKGEFEHAGMTAAQRVMIMATPQIDFFVSLFATWKLGAIPFIIDSLQSSFELQGQIETIHPHWIWAGTLNSHPRADAAELCPPLPSDTALVLFTSGTSAKPKAVIHRFSNLSARFESGRRAIPVQNRRRVLCTLPLHFSHGLISVALQATQDSEILVLCPKFGFSNFSLIGNWIDTHKIDFVSGTPATWDLITRFSPRPRNFSLRRVQLASAHATKRLFCEIASWSATSVFHCYGLTETASWFSDHPVDLNGSEFPVGDGKRWGARIRLGPDGQIQVSTASLFAGYWGEWSPEDRVIEWFDTGDIGRLLPDGNLVLIGRSKRQINRGGLKVSPEEVEAAILETKLLNEVVVVEAPSIGGEVSSIAAIATVEESVDQPLLIAAIEKQLLESLTPAKIPSSWHFVDKIPRRSNGKPDLLEIGLLLKSK